MRESLIADNKPPTFEHRLTKKRPNNLPIDQLIKSSDQCFSLELCPNRYLDAKLLNKLNPSFCSVTWHSPSQSDLENVDRIPAMVLAENLCCQGYNVLLHLAGRYLERDEAILVLNRARVVGVRNIFVIQGDPSRIIEKDEERCFPHAAHLVEFIRSRFGNYFCIGVAGYPEKHPQSALMADDIEYLKHKVSLGADFIITQASYSYRAIENFAKICKSSGITIPILPGLFVFGSEKSLNAMSTLCGVPVAENILNTVDKMKENNTAVREFGIFLVTDLAKNILNGKGCLFYGVHTFTLNDLKLTEELMKRLGFYKMEIDRPLREADRYRKSLFSASDVV